MITPPAPASPLLPVNDNSAAPYFAVYRWGQAGLNHGLYDAYDPWLNRSVIWGEDFMPNNQWDSIEGGGWQLGPWRDWVNAKPGRRFILSVPVLVGGWDGKGPTKGPAANVPISLEEGAKGTYNIYFQHLAEHLVNTTSATPSCASAGNSTAAGIRGTRLAQPRRRPSPVTSSRSSPPCGPCPARRT